MELIILIVIVCAVVGGFKQKTNCTICNTEFGERALIYKWTIDGKKHALCSRCNRKLAAQQSNEAFDAFFGRGHEKTNGTTRKSIKASVKREVWRRDQGRCVQCGSQKNLEYDHIIPVSRGGSNTERNLQLLCEHCNRVKSNKIC